MMHLHDFHKPINLQIYMLWVPAALFVNIRWELRLAAGEAAIPDPIPARKMHWETQPWASALGWPWHTPSSRERDPSLASQRFCSGKETEPSKVLSFIFNLFHGSDGKIQKAEGENCCGFLSAAGGIWNKTLPCLCGKIKVFWKPEKMSLSFQYWLVFIEHTHFC